MAPVAYYAWLQMAKPLVWPGGHRLFIYPNDLKSRGSVV